MPRCELTGTDLGDLRGEPYFMINDDEYGTAYIDVEADAKLIVAVVNGEREGVITFGGTDLGDMIGTPLHEVLLDGEAIGYAEAGWLQAANVPVLSSNRP